MGSSAMCMRTTFAFLLVAGLVVAGLSASAVATPERAEMAPGLRQPERHARQVAGLDEQEAFEDFIHIVWLIATNQKLN